MTFGKSLTGRLFRLIFGGYVVLAILVTVTQLALEYRSTRQMVAHDLVSLGLSFRDSMTGAMWELDRPLLRTMARGLAQSSMVTGVKVVAENGEEMARVGKIPTEIVADPDSPMAPFQSSREELNKQTPTGLRHLGVLTLFADRSVVLERIKHSFFVILINSFIKTLGLWIIFFLVISKTLAHPLSQLTEQVSRMEFAAGSQFPLDYPHLDELGRLMSAMRTMQERLSASRVQLEQVHHTLEETIEERTLHLTEALEFNNRMLLDSPLPMGVYAQDGHCLLANQAYARMVGATREALLAQNFHQIHTWQTTGLLNDCIFALTHMTPQQREINVVTTFGKEVWLEARILPTHLQGERLLLMQFIDWTERKISEEKLRQAMEAAESASRIKGEFLANMSHEIRTPMNAILGLTGLVRESRLDDMQQNYLRKIQDASKDLLRILNDILDYSKIEANHLDIEQVPFSVIELLQNLRDLHEARIREAGLAFHLEIDPALSCIVAGDPLRLAQVLNNLVGNAIKFTERGSIHVRARHQGEDVMGIWLAFEVSDTGIGIDAKLASSLFQPFTQAHRSISRRYGGTGLGLAICDRLVRLMGGEIQVQSVPDKGSSFTFTVRVGPHRDAWPPVREEMPPSRLAGLHFAQAMVLLVEDHPLNQEVAREYLMRMGLNVTVANHGGEALAMLRHQRFDAILMDLRMPVMDGIATSEQIRRIPELANLPIIATTAAVMAEDRARCLQVGIHDIVSKPMEPDALKCALARWLPMQSAGSPAMTGGPDPAAGDNVLELLAILRQLMPKVSRFESIPSDQTRALVAYTQHPEWGVEVRNLLEQLNSFSFEAATGTLSALIGKIS
ncbi:MAG: response regulator [Magnetococcales bacterium]|nr:response regulator [Magnetococcales bacterium]